MSGRLLRYRTGWRRTVPIAALCGLLMAACGGGTAVKSSTPTSSLASKCTQTYKFTLFAGGGGAPVGYAPLTTVPQGAGFWKDNCLDVTVLATNGTLLGVQGLATGADNAIATANSATVKADEQGQKDEAIFEIAYSNYDWLAVPENSTITRITQLAGKPIGVASLSDAELTLFNAEAKEAGMTKPLDFVAVGDTSGAIAALEDGQVSALGLWIDPYENYIAAGYKLRYLHSPLEADVSWAVSLVASENYVNSNQAAVTGFLRGVAEGIAFSRDNPDAAAKINYSIYPASMPAGLTGTAAEAAGATAIRARLAIWTPPKGVALGAASEQAVNTYAEYMLAQGTITSPLSASSLYTNQFITAANTFNHAAVESLATNWK